LQLQVIFEVVEVAVVMQQLVVFLYAEGGDKRVYCVADRNA
jgi:hypothetical protein